MDTILIESISQRDPRWSDILIGTGSNRDMNIGNWGCLLVAYCMLAWHLELTEDDPVQLNARMVAAGAFGGPYLQNGAFKRTFPGQVEYDGWLKRDRHGNEAVDTAAIELLEQGIPVAAQVDFYPQTARWEQHWVLLAGFNKYDGFIMADPWYGDVLPVRARYDISGHDLIQVLCYRPVEPPADSTSDNVTELQDLVEELTTTLMVQTHELEQAQAKLRQIVELAQA